MLALKFEGFLLLDERGVHISVMIGILELGETIVMRRFLHPRVINLNLSHRNSIIIRDHPTTSMSLIFSNNRSAIIQSSWLDPKKIREMTIVGSRRMIAYDDTVSVGKIKIYDARVEKPPHYDSFAEFQYAYHHGDMYAPFVKQEEPLKLQCQHFLDCIREGRTPLSGGARGAEVVQILEAASRSLKQNGGSIQFTVPPQISNRVAHNGDSERVVVVGDHLTFEKNGHPVSVAKNHHRDPHQAL